MDLEQLHRRARLHRANPFIYGIVRVTFQAVFHLYFRFQRIGREHIPRTGPVIIAANHRSFLDPFVIACMARRPMYYVAKKEIFDYSRVMAWLLAALGAFPIQRGAADAESIETATAILARGDIVLIFPEGTRTRPGGLGRPKRGVGRLALETGAPVVPVAVIGTDEVRRGWRIRPRKVRIRAGRALRFPRVQDPSPALAGAVTDRIWPCVMLQWEWLGGLPPMRRAAVIGGGARGVGIAGWLARAGVEVDLGCSSPEQVRTLQAGRETVDSLGAETAAGRVRVLPLADLNLDSVDTVCLAVPAAELPSVLGAHGGRITSRSGLLVACDGMMPPLGTLPSEFAAERSRPWAVAVLGGPASGESPPADAPMVVASSHRGLARQIAAPLTAAGLDVAMTKDIIGVQLAGCATAVAAFAATVAGSSAGTGVAGAAAGKVFAEVDALARARGAHPETFAGVAGAGALVAAIMDAAAALPAPGEPPASSRERALGARFAAETIPLLIAAAHRERVRAPMLEGLAALIEGRIATDQWAEKVSGPAPVGRATTSAAAA